MNGHLPDQEHMVAILKGDDMLAKVSLKLDMVLHLIKHLHDALTPLPDSLRILVNCLDEFESDWRDHVANERKDFTDDTKLRLRAVCLKFYEGKCPKCLMVTIVDEELNTLNGMQHDHFYERSHNHFSNGWTLCRACHGDKTHRRKSRAEFETPFKEFQRRADENGFNPDKQNDSPKLF